MSCWHGRQVETQHTRLGLLQVSLLLRERSWCTLHRDGLLQRRWAHQIDFSSVVRPCGICTPDLWHCDIEFAGDLQQRIKNRAHNLPQLGYFAEEVWHGRFEHSLKRHVRWCNTNLMRVSGNTSLFHTALSGSEAHPRPQDPASVSLCASIGSCDSSSN